MTPTITTLILLARAPGARIKIVNRTTHSSTPTRAVGIQPTSSMKKRPITASLFHLLLSRFHRVSDVVEKSRRADHPLCKN
jgi:hypothetical protein